MERSEIPFLSASELSRLIESGEVSPVEATEAYLDRIGAVDGQLNSYIVVLKDHARASARQAEGEIAAGQLPRAAARDAGGGEGPVLHRRNGNNGRLFDTARFRAKRRQHGDGKAERGWGRAAGQAQHERVCHGRHL